MLADNRNYPRDEPSICFPFLNCLLLEAENQKTILQRFSNSNKSFFRCFIHLFKGIHSDGNFSLIYKLSKEQHSPAAACGPGGTGPSAWLSATVHVHAIFFFY